nr:alkyl hydroperoxide reductase [Rhizobium sp. Q54]
MVQKEFGIKEYTDTSHDVMIPHTIILGRNLKIFKIYNGYYYWGRPSVAELHADLRAVAQQTYRDWDITEPELKAKWKEGDKSDFYPYSEDSISMERLMLQMAGATDQYAGRNGR